MLTQGAKDAEQYGHLNPTARQLIEIFWPGYLGVIVEKKALVSDAITAGRPTVLLACLPDLGRALPRGVEGPVVASSVNRAGTPPALDIQDVFPVLVQFDIEPTFVNYKRFMFTFVTALPDVHHTIEEMVAEEERVWVNYTIRGTHEGLFRNVPATHKQISYRVIAMYRVINGKIVEADFQSDDVSLLRQLGILST